VHTVTGLDGVAAAHDDIEVVALHAHGDWKTARPRAVAPDLRRGR